MEHSDKFFRLMEPQIRFWGKNFSQKMQHGQYVLRRTEIFTDVEISLTWRGNLKASTARVSQICPLFLIPPKSAHTVLWGAEAPRAQPGFQVLEWCRKVTGNVSPKPDSKKGPQQI